jgi:pimeloyl-ACP methyl ester carboxylesterase
MDDLIVEGMGRSILVLHGGMGDLSSWAKVTDRLRDRFRVARLYRRQYRLDVPRKVTMADETEEVLAAAATLDHPVLVGHSSGAVLALEALAARPDLFAGGVLYEPPVVVDRPLGGEPVDRARVALAARRPGTAFAIFLRDVVGMRGPTVRAAEFAMNRQGGEIGAKVERQLDDNDAIDALGNRLDAYSKIELPVLLLAGDRSPHHLHERLDTLRSVLPDVQRVTMHGQGHTAERSAPERVAEIVARFADEADPARAR